MLSRQTCMTGVHSVSELKSRGLTDGRIRKLARSGDLVQLRRGWYAENAADPIVRQAVTAGGVLSCVSALRRFGIWIPPDDRRVHVRLPLRNRCDRSSCRGYGSMPPLSTAVDPLLVAYNCAARCLNDEGFVAVSDSILYQTHHELADLRHAVSAGPRRLLSLLERCDGRAMSGTESIARVRFRGAGLKVKVQFYIRGVGYVDLLIGDRLIVECDSREFHTAASNYQTDRTRDRRSLVDDYITIRVTYEDVMFRWDEVMRDVLELVKRREHRKRRLGA
jgi:very-short-patch-repair endonuclease